MVIDAKTGEILALSNLPVFNPNNRRNYDPQLVRNRTVIDTFEPGSTMKPFTAAAVLERGLFTPESVIDTTDGLVVGNKRIRDEHPHPFLTVTEIIQKSSNIGAVKMAMTLTPAQFWDTLHRAGFGQKPGSGFPGEASGHLRNAKIWKPVEQATMAYGYGLSASLFQMAHSYTSFAHDGQIIPVTMLKSGEPAVGLKVFSAENARAVRRMLQMAAAPGGTGTLAQTVGYSVGGKSGTAHKQVGKGYASNKYRAWFTGMAPIEAPRIIVAVMIDEPSNGKYFGGIVAAPVFSEVVQQTLRMMGAEPDISVKPQIVTQPVEESF